MKVRIAAVVLSFLAGMAMGSVLFRPQVYLGVGVGRTLSATFPGFRVDDVRDQNFLAINGSLQRQFVRGQIRLNFVHAGCFSLGYAFWGHSLNYPADYPEVWFKTDRQYPASDRFSVHAVLLQWTPSWFAMKRLQGFVFAGAGRFFGSQNQRAYLWSGPDSSFVLDSVGPSASFEGNALRAGIGAILFKHGYAAVEFTRLGRSGLAANDFLDLVVGVVF